jgi:glycosyltransferase involved in cell wall biosynthesis
MLRMTVLFKKLMLSALVVGLYSMALPLSSVSATSPSDLANPPLAQRDPLRLERIWMREQLRFQREGFLLSQADAVIDHAQTLIDKASAKSLEISAVQAALEAFSAAIPAVQAEHDRGTPIISNHAGFDANGKVTDPAAAIETAKALAQVLKDTRLALNGSGRALHQAIREFRLANRKNPNPAP